MGRYIDLDKCGQYRTNHGGYPDTFAFPPWTEFEDVAPVVHAHWILGGAHGFDEGITNIMHCSNCKAYFRYHGRKQNVNYCYRCGAVMDEPMKFKQK